MFLDSHRQGCSSKIDEVDEDAAEIGTYRWMAPELIRREEGQTVEWLLCDMYSLGVIFWEMLARDLYAESSCA